MRRQRLVSSRGTKTKSATRKPSRQVESADAATWSRKRDFNSSFATNNRRDNLELDLRSFVQFSSESEHRPTSTTCHKSNHLNQQSEYRKNINTNTNTHYSSSSRGHQKNEMKAARSFALVLVLGLMALAVGCSGSKPDTNIMGSINTSLAEFPSMAAIEVQHEDAKDWVFSCSGVVLNEKHVLTKQNCVTMKNTKYRLSIGRDMKPHNYEIDKILTFPADENMNFKIAILSLKQKIQGFGWLIKPAKIADYDLSNNSHPNRTLSAVGWGRSWYVGSASEHIWYDQSELKHRLSPTLRKVDVKFQSISKCRKILEILPRDFKIICTTDQKGEYMEKLDLGGPLFHGRGDEQQLVGLPYSANRFPFMFLDVTKIKSLIEGSENFQVNSEAEESSSP